MKLAIIYTSSVTIFTFLQICSTTKLAVKTRIINGKVAKNGQFPFVVVINPVGCGGSLIHVKWVISASHCFYKRMKRATVLMGNVNLVEPPIVMESEKFFVHPNYNDTIKDYDIGLLELPEPVTLSDRIQPIKISANPDDTYPGRVVLLTGYGATKSRDGKIYPDDLNYVRLRMIDNWTCKYYFPVLTNSMMCTFGLTNIIQGSCKGDSGSGLLAERPEGRMVLVGVTTLRHSDCEGAFPTIHSRVIEQIPWITSVTGLTDIIES